MPAQSVHALVQGAGPGLDQAVRVGDQGQGGPRQQFHRRVGTRLLGHEAQEDPLAVGQTAGHTLVRDQQRRGVTGVRPGQLAPARVLRHAGEDQRGHGDLGDALRRRVVEPLHDLARRLLLGHRVRPEDVAQLRHARRGLQVMTDDVPHGEGGGAVHQGERVVPVAAHVGGIRRGQVADGHAAAGCVRELRQQMALHGLGDLALTLVEAGVLQGHAGASGDVLQQGGVHRGEPFGLRGPAQGDGTHHVVQAAQGHHDGRVHAGRLKPLLHGDPGVGRALIGLGVGESGRDTAQRAGQGHLGLLRHRWHGPLEVLPEDHGAALGLGDREVPHFALLTDQVDDRPVGDARHHQGDQVAEAFVDLQGRGEQGGRLGEQGQPFQFGEPSARTVTAGRAASGARRSGRG